ncbi:MAG: NAD(P)H-quinone oxidoreductase [Acidobacteriia bacterium]|nr:NAD(P)H-quinone oxidoreductase [Terriglobia bacterium]
MQAVWMTRPGGPEVLRIQEVPRPVIAADQVLVKVRASALNRADLLQRQGRYPAPPGFPQEIPGIEFAGEIAETGPTAHLWKPGDRVFGLTGGGAQAEYVVTHERLLAGIPGRLNWAEAAAIPEAFITAHDALWKQADLRPGETVLVHAVGSGVGLAAVQLARAIHAVPYGTSRTAGKLDQARACGLEAGVVVSNDSPQSLDAMIAASGQWTAEKGINVVLDLVGGPYVKASQRLMAIRGRLMLVGSVAGGNYELESRFVMGRRLQIIGTVLRARSLEEKIQVTQAFAAEVVPLLATGTVRPNIDSQFKMSEISQAHERLESNRTFGKVVVEW